MEARTEAPQMEVRTEAPQMEVRTEAPQMEARTEAPQMEARRAAVGTHATTASSRSAAPRSLRATPAPTASQWASAMTLAWTMLVSTLATIPTQQAKPLTTPSSIASSRAALANASSRVDRSTCSLDPAIRRFRRRISGNVTKCTASFAPRSCSPSQPRRRGVPNRKNGPAWRPPRSQARRPPKRKPRMWWRLSPPARNHFRRRQPRSAPCARHFPTPSNQAVVLVPISGGSIRPWKGARYLPPVMALVTSNCHRRRAPRHRLPVGATTFARTLTARRRCRIPHGTLACMAPCPPTVRNANAGAQAIRRPRLPRRNVLAAPNRTEAPGVAHRVRTTMRKVERRAETACRGVE